jgi:ankyrin repeat protein
MRLRNSLQSKFSLLPICACIVILVGISIWPALRRAEVNRNLREAIKRGDVERARANIRDGADLNYSVSRQDASGLIIRILDVLQHHTPASEQSDDNAPPLVEAVRQDRLSIAVLLLENGAQSDVRDSEGRTPLMLIWDSTHWSEWYSLLTRYGAKPELWDTDGANCLDYAVAHLNWDAVITLLDRSPRANGSIEWKRRYGEILIDACGNGATDVAEKLLNLGADPNYRRPTGYTPLYNAVLADDLDTAKVLLDRGASVDLHSKGDTPLACAIGKDNMAMAKLLRKYGAR